MNLSKIFLLFSATALASLGSVHGALIWTGAGDGISLYAENNWLDDNGSVPAANTINSATAITAVTGGTILIDSSGTGAPTAFGGTFTIGANDVTVDNTTLQSTGTSGIIGTAGNAMTIENGGFVNIQFITLTDITLDSGSTVQFRGAGNPVNNSTIDVLDTDSMIQFTNETFAAAELEHFDKITFNGAALEFGSDPFVQEPGDNLVVTALNGTLGSKLTFVVPEPGTSGLLAFGLGLLMLRRRS